MFADVRYAGEGAPIHAITARISETRKTIWLGAFKVGMFPPLYKISLARPEIPLSVTPVTFPVQITQVN
jgi:hypothetical protein